MKNSIVIFLLLFTVSAAYSQGGIKGTRNGMPAAITTPSTPLSIPMNVVIFQENMDNVNNLISSGWVFNDVDGVGATTFYQGNSTLVSYNGATDSYLAQNYSGAFGGGLLIDQWLITPQITSYRETTFSFWTRSAGGGPWNDHIYIYYSPTGSTNLADFILLRDRTVVPLAWTQFSETVTANGSVRFAIRYYETNGGPSGADSNFFGIDAVQVVGNPVSVPVSIWWILAAFVGLAGFTVIRFRIKRA